MTGVKISKVGNADLEELAILVNSAYRGESSKQGWTTEADLLDGLRTDEGSLEELLQKPGTVLLAARNEANRMVGCMYLHKQRTQLYLGMLTVAPDQQANGIGKYMLANAEEYAREMACNSVIMTVIDIRHELINWYKRKGYQSTGETKPFPTDERFGIAKQPLQFIVLEKTIPL